MPLSVASVEGKFHFHPGAAAIEARMSFFLKWKWLQYLGHSKVSRVTGGASAKLTHIMAVQWNPAIQGL